LEHRRPEIDRIGQYAREITPITCENSSTGGDSGTNETIVPDILVRNIEESVAERIKAIARERDWSINEVVLYILRHSLGFGGEDIVRREIQDIAALGGTWDPREAAAFRTALEAFEQIDGTPLFVNAAKRGDQPPK
jgi:hypothetical protein